MHFRTVLVVRLCRRDSFLGWLLALDPQSLGRQEKDKIDLQIEMCLSKQIYYRKNNINTTSERFSAKTLSAHQTFLDFHLLIFISQVEGDWLGFDVAICQPIKSFLIFISGMI